jgi:glycosyltransferase involved in cell wall biosynthesis
LHEAVGFTDGPGNAWHGCQSARTNRPECLNAMASKRRILIVSDYGYTLGGAEVCMLQLMEGLRQRGHHVRLVASSAGMQSVAEESHIADDLVFGTTTSLRALVQAYNPRAERQLRAIIDEFQPDLIHLNIFLTQLSSEILDACVNTPVLHHAHWYRLVCMNGLKMLPDGSPCSYPAGLACLKRRCVPVHDWLPLIWQLLRLQQRLRSIQAIVAPSETVRKRLEAEGLTVDFVIPYGVEVLERRPPLSDPPRIGFAGRLVAAKGGETLLQAFSLVLAQLPDCRLDIFGSGSQEGLLKKRCRTLGMADQVKFFGWVERAALQRALAPCWVQAAVSVFEEPFGMVAVEAAMRGTAVVASNHGGYRETVVDGVTGILVPPLDVEATAAALLRVLKDRSYAETLGRAGRQHALAHFGLQAFLSRFETAIEETIQRHRAGTACQTRLPI